MRNKHEEYIRRIGTLNSGIIPLENQLKILITERNKLLQYFRVQKQRKNITEKEYKNIKNVIDKT